MLKRTMILFFYNLTATVIQVKKAFESLINNHPWKCM